MNYVLQNSKVTLAVEEEDVVAEEAVAVAASKV